MLQQADSGEKNEKLLEKNCLFSSKANDRKWAIELLLLKENNKGFKTLSLALSSAVSY